MTQTEVEMKDWQKGYQLDYLKEITAEYDHYNSYTDSPFDNIQQCRVCLTISNNPKCV